MYKSSFQKRAFNLRSFITALRELFVNLSDWRKLRAQPSIDPGFSEKIMLAVTQVNDCRYCSYVHTRKALNAGVPQAEIRSIMGGDLEHSPQDQLVALVFAQHYAESAGKPDDQAFRQLERTYGQDSARKILAYTRIIYFANLLGNTFDKLLYYLGILGRRRPTSKPAR